MDYWGGGGGGLFHIEIEGKYGWIIGAGRGGGWPPLFLRLCK